MKEDYFDISLQSYAMSRLYFVVGRMYSIARTSVIICLRLIAVEVFVCVCVLWCSTLIAKRK